MNILPQKSWHVRRKENVERVRRDEAKAEELRLEQEKRHSVAEAEALRARLGKSQSNSDFYDRSGHLNLFADRDFDCSKLNKAEHKETETKEETEKWARKVGIIVGLSDKMEEKNNHWLFGKNSSKITGSELPSVSATGMKMVDQLTREKAEKKDLKRKSIEDPMNIFAISSTNKGGDASSKKYSIEAAFQSLDAAKNNISCHSKSSHSSSHNSKHRKKSKKSKSKKRKKRRSSSSESSSESESSGRNCEEEKKVKLDQLRKERLAREERERKRAQLLLSQI